MPRDLEPGGDINTAVAKQRRQIALDYLRALSHEDREEFCDEARICYADGGDITAWPGMATIATKHEEDDGTWRCEYLDGVEGDPADQSLPLDDEDAANDWLMARLADQGWHLSPDAVERG